MQITHRIDDSDVGRQYSSTRSERGLSAKSTLSPWHWTRQFYRRGTVAPGMSAASSQYWERGAFQRLPASRRAYHDGGQAHSNTTPSMATLITEHDFRFPRRPDHYEPTKPTIAQPTSTQFSRRRQAAATPRSRLDQSTADAAARSEIMRGSLFPAWKDDTGVEEDLDNPEEMQKKDPLATQIWKLYARTKKSLPNQQRMENLTWRMMAMTLRRKRQEEAARYALEGKQHVWITVSNMIK